MWLGDRFAVRRRSSLPTMLSGGRFTALTDSASTGTFRVRAVEPGDHLDIGIGSTPVTELLRVHGVPSDHRPVSPLIVDDAKIAAVVGVRTATWAKPQSGEPVIVIEREVTV